MRAPSLRAVTTEAKLLLVGIPVVIWTLLPIYHLFLFAISPKQDAFAGKLWPDNPTLRNFEIVFGQKHYFLSHFWLQLWNSLLIAVASGVITLLIATGAAFAISRLKVRGGRAVMNLALFTYFIPAAFLAVPMYKTMGIYGLLNSQWALIWAMVTIASPYAIWVLKQASDKLPLELDEAAKIDGAGHARIFFTIILRLVAPIIAVVGLLSFLATFGEFVIASVLLVDSEKQTLAVGLYRFVSQSTATNWSVFAAGAVIAAILPVALFLALQRFIVGGLTAGSVK